MQVIFSIFLAFHVVFCYLRVVRSYSVYFFVLVVRVKYVFFEDVATTTL